MQRIILLLLIGTSGTAMIVRFEGGTRAEAGAGGGSGGVSGGSAADVFAELVSMYVFICR